MTHVLAFYHTEVDSSVYSICTSGSNAALKRPSAGSPVVSFIPETKICSWSPASLDSVTHFHCFSSPLLWPLHLCPFWHRFSKWRTVQLLPPLSSYHRPSTVVLQLGGTAGKSAKLLAHPLCVSPACGGQTGWRHPRPKVGGRACALPCLPAGRHKILPEGKHLVT